MLCYWCIVYWSSLYYYSGLKHPFYCVLRKESESGSWRVFAPHLTELNEYVVKWIKTFLLCSRASPAFQHSILFPVAQIINFFLIFFKTDFIFLRALWPLLVTFQNWPERCGSINFSYLNSVYRISGGRHLISESQVAGGVWWFFCCFFCCCCFLQIPVWTLRIQNKIALHRLSRKVPSKNNRTYYACILPFQCTLKMIC